MKKVFKHTLGMKDDFILELPIDSKPLSIQIQDGQPQMWVLVDPIATIMEKRYFRMCGTGHLLNYSQTLCFIDTFQLHGGDLIFHVFEVLND